MKYISSSKIGRIIRVTVSSLCTIAVFHSCAPRIEFSPVPIDSGLELFLDSTGLGCVIGRDAIVSTTDFFRSAKDTLSLDGLLFHDAYGNSKESFLSDGSVFCFLYREEPNRTRRILSKIDIHSGVVQQCQCDLPFNNMVEYEDSVVLWGFSDSIAIVNKNLDIIRYYDMGPGPGPAVYSNGVLYVALETEIATISDDSKGHIDTGDYRCLALISNGKKIWAVCAKEESYFKYVVFSIENNKLEEIKPLDYALVLEECKAYGNSIEILYQPLSTMLTFRKFVFYSLDGGKHWKRCREPFRRIAHSCIVNDTLFYIPQVYPLRVPIHLQTICLGILKSS